MVPDFQIAQFGVGLQFKNLQSLPGSGKRKYIIRHHLNKLFA